LSFSIGRRAVRGLEIRARSSRARTELIEWLRARAAGALGKPPDGH